MSVRRSNGWTESAVNVLGILESSNKWLHCYRSISRWQQNHSPTVPLTLEDCTLPFKFMDDLVPNVTFVCFRDGDFIGYWGISERFRTNGSKERMADENAEWQWKEFHGCRERDKGLSQSTRPQSAPVYDMKSRCHLVLESSGCSPFWRYVWIDDQIVKASDLSFWKMQISMTKSYRQHSLESKVWWTQDHWPH